MGCETGKESKAQATSCAFVGKWTDLLVFVDTHQGEIVP
jgi:hypothetical protein